jgi:regulatory protein
MGKITKINLQKSLKRANIFIDNNFKFGIDFDNLLKFNLKVGDEVEEKELEKIIFKAEASKLLESLGKFLSLRPRSRKEIIERIKIRIFKKDLADFIDKESLKTEVLEKIEKNGLINDREFSLWFIKQRTTFRPKSKKALFFELRKKGIDLKIIDEVLEKFNDQREAFKIIEKKKYILEKLPLDKKKEKITSILSYRGFCWETIKNVLQKFID